MGVSAGAVIINNEGKYFLAKRGNGARDDAGKWELPGGATKFYEIREQAVLRNIKEKHNFEIAIDQVLGIYDVIDTKNKDHCISTTYICRSIDRCMPTIVNSEKCSDIGWFSFEELHRLDLSRITTLNVEDLNRKQY